MWGSIWFVSVRGVGWEGLGQSVEFSGWEPGMLKVLQWAGHCCTTMPKVLQSPPEKQCALLTSKPCSVPWLLSSLGNFLLSLELIIVLMFLFFFSGSFYDWLFVPQYSDISQWCVLICFHPQFWASKGNFQPGDFCTLVLDYFLKLFHKWFSSFYFPWLLLIHVI